MSAQFQVYLLKPGYTATWTTDQIVSIKMAHQVFWRVPHQTLCVVLEGDLSIEDFHQLNRKILGELGEESANRCIALIVDITRPGSIPQAFAQLKASQTYVSRRDLKFILVAGSNKFMRLMMLLTFNLCRPSLRFFDTIDQASAFVQMVFPALQQ